jgi:exosortase
MASHPDSLAKRPALGWSRDWSWGVLPVALVLLVVGIMPATFDFLVRNTWSTLGYSHGPLVALISLVLIWRVGTELRPTSRVSIVPIFLLLSALTAWVAARFAFIDLAQQLLAIGLAGLALWCAYGLQPAMRFAFPVGFAVFAIPVWDFFIDPLQRVTTHANELALAAFGIPAHITGNVIAVPAGTFEIADGCSGLHFFIAALAVSSLHAYLQRYTLRWSLVTVAMAVALALVTNWIRVLVIIWRGNATAMQTSLIDHHYWFGWYLFAGALVVFFLIVGRFPRSAFAPDPDPHAVNAVRSTASERGWAGVIAPVLLLAACGIGMAAKWSAWAASRPTLVLPPATAGWSGPEGTTLPEWTPGFVGAATSRSAVYRAPGANGMGSAVHVTGLVYTVQGTGGKLIGFGSGVAPSGWHVVEDRALDPAWRYAEVQSPTGERWAVVYGFAVGDDRTSDARRVRLLQALNGFRRPRNSAAETIAVRCDPGCEDAGKAIRSFLDAHPDLQRPWAAEAGS